MDYKDTFLAQMDVGVGKLTRQFTQNVAAGSDSLVTCYMDTPILVGVDSSIGGHVGGRRETRAQ